MACVRKYMKKFFKQFKKINTEPLEKSNMLWSWIGSFLGIFTIVVVHNGILGDNDLNLVIGSFGASAVLVYGAIHSPLSQPRNLIGGHVLSAIIGVISYKVFHDHLLFAAAFFPVPVDFTSLLAASTGWPPSRIRV